LVLRHAEDLDADDLAEKARAVTFRDPRYE
jgi:hypothetical protein